MVKVRNWLTYRVTLGMWTGWQSRAQQYRVILSFVQLTPCLVSNVDTRQLTCARHKRKTWPTRYLACHINKRSKGSIWTNKLGNEVSSNLHVRIRTFWMHKLDGTLVLIDLKARHDFIIFRLGTCLLTEKGRHVSFKTHTCTCHVHVACACTMMTIED